VINGTAPKIGAQVYDILLGYGKIQSVEPDMSFVVTFSGGRQSRYSKGGYIGTSRRVYWDNPIIVEPACEDPVWGTFTDMGSKMYALLNTIKGK
jgi:hypothetical protein